jgi:RNA polymerase sigma-70 factor (ECF subfamily)
VAMVDGSEAGLRLIDDIIDGGALDGYHVLHATHAELLRRARRWEEAAAAYRRAIALCRNGAESRHLTRQLTEMIAGIEHCDERERFAVSP